jgi:hypothetical protein
MRGELTGCNGGEKPVSSEHDCMARGSPEILGPWDDEKSGVHSQAEINRLVQSISSSDLPGRSQLSSQDYRILHLLGFLPPGFRVVGGSRAATIALPRSEYGVRAGMVGAYLIKDVLKLVLC